MPFKVFLMVLINLLKGFLRSNSRLFAIKIDFDLILFNSSGLLIIIFVGFNVKSLLLLSLQKLFISDVKQLYLFLYLMLYSTIRLRVKLFQRININCNFFNDFVIMNANMRPSSKNLTQFGKMKIYKLLKIYSTVQSLFYI